MRSIQTLGCGSCEMGIGRGVNPRLGAGTTIGPRGRTTLAGLGSGLSSQATGLAIMIGIAGTALLLSVINRKKHRRR